MSEGCFALVGTEWEQLACKWRDPKNILSAVIRFDWFFPESSGTDRYRLQADYQWSDDRRGMQ